MSNRMSKRIRIALIGLALVAVALALAGIESPRERARTRGEDAVELHARPAGQPGGTPSRFAR